MAGEVFISYSQPDRDCAFELVARLEGEGINCWIAPRDIAPSADWAAEIMDAISAARVMILVFSASSNQSPQVRREVERAVHKQLSILPFRVEDVLPSKSLEFFLSTQHWLDAFPPPREPHYARLCAYLKPQLAAEPIPPSPIVGRTAGGAATYPFDISQLQHIERQLAGYIGPLARHLVKTTALRAAGVDDLVSRLATELDSEPQRREFAQRCKP
ncbi:MAG TPA: toll/interleukin-1 receptor domain-containing protein [Steroidobacteraceae bacterium]|nr:toll/interleukin-1 receptor domain-containing protein [Steroidobacteraceae bacterium]